MKSRSHRLPIAESHDDWGDGSWTVDCVCGVNFDDGEEMVNCDECGVWVHTRCSRYVKSEKSFACDKCKSKCFRNNDSEETEVAQLLVDLPNKTLRMDNLYPLNGPSRRPVKLYTDISTEKKVHVHGIPGGDPSLFAGLSSVFSPQLWKCTGYVPKKFNFQYTEFPSWDEKESEQVQRRNQEERDNAAENENKAGVLFSLLKETASVTPLESSEGVKCQVKDGTASKAANSGRIKSTGEIKESSFARNAVDKDSSLRQPAVVDSVKHKKKERLRSKDRRERNRIGIHEKEKDPKKKTRIASTTASTISSDGKQFEFYEDRGPKVIKVYTENSKIGESRHPAHVDQLSNDLGVRGININNDRKHASADECDAETKKFDSSRCYTNSDGRLKQDTTGGQRPSKIENSHKVEVVSGTLDSPNANGGGSGQRMAEFQKAQHVVEQLAVASREVTESKNSQGFFADIASSSEPNAGAETEVDKNLDVLNVHHSPSSEEKLEGMELSAHQVEVSAINLSEHVKKSDVVISSSKTSDQMADGDKSTPGGDYYKDDSWAGGCQSKPELPTVGSRDCSSGHKSGSICSDGSLSGRKSSSQLKTGSKYVEGVCKLDARTSSSDPNHLKVLVGKSSSKTYKSSTSGSQSPANVPSHSTSSKQRGMSKENPSTRRDAGSSAEFKDEKRIERSKKITKTTPESSISHSSKISQSSRFSHAPVPKGSSSVPKESLLHSSPKLLTPSATAIPTFAESTSSLKNAGASNVHDKVVGSGLPEKSEKNSRHDSQPSSKVSASQMQPPVSSVNPSGLSDEELALLLHQQLNSSPRVPRVPRMRHAGSLPQLASPTTASMLMKRTSSSGSKDFNSSSRRKSKESRKDGAHSAQDVSDEAKKVERVSSPDHRGQGSLTTNPLVKGEMDNLQSKDLVRKNKPPASTATTSSGLSSSTEVNEYKVCSTRNSPRHASDGDSGAVGRPTPLTLPGLIAKIMSKGERMTLEELCNAVLPHWPHLRKHNGEPYAYSSHSNAVLDCLRNRNEWARLVDRGPKTSTSKKRRKSDAEPSGGESDDNVRRERTAKDGRSKSLESQAEEFPKGKRKARKRRRLALHGRGIKDFRRRRRAEVVSDDEDGTPSNSSGDSESSKDETQGEGDGTSGTNEASASSDETSN